MIGAAVRQLNKAIKQYPSLMPDIMEAWELTRSEISEGGSEENEAEHFMEWLEQRVKEHTSD